MKKSVPKPKAERKRSGVSYAYPELEDDRGGRFLLPFSLSIIGHALLLAAIVLMPQTSSQKTFTPTVINVRMVSLNDIASSEPGPGPVESVEVESPPKIEPETAPEPSPATPVETAPEPAVVMAPSEPKESEKPAPEKPTAKPARVPAPEPEVSLAAPEKKPEKKPEVPEPKKIKKSLKKKTFKPSEIVRNAIEKLEQETEESRPTTVLDAIAKIRKDLEEKPPKAVAPKQPPTSTRSSAGTPGGAGSGRGGRGGSGTGALAPGLFDVYHVEIAYRIQSNWAFSEQLAGNRQNLETLVVIEILPNGQIDRVWFDKKSGNKYLDDSAMRAVKKSNPLPPLPRDFRGRSYTTGLRFTPEGLSR